MEEEFEAIPIVTFPKRKSVQLALWGNLGLTTATFLGSNNALMISSFPSALSPANDGGKFLGNTYTFLFEGCAVIRTPSEP